MRDPARISRIIEKLRRAWLNSPDQRLGQLVMNTVAFAEERRIDDVFYIEDDITERGLDKILDDLRHPKPSTARGRNC